MIKQRRKPVNKTGIDRIPLTYNASDAWVAYICVNCKKINYVHIGEHLISPKETYENAHWTCSHCGFVHSKDSDLPSKWSNWNEDLLINEQMTVQRFWKAFFTSCTGKPEFFWKQCNVCGRILPNSYFSRHAGWGPLEKQMECKACKGAINAKLNPKRTAEQLRESGIRRRIADMFIVGENERVDIDALFDRFGGKCFKSGRPLEKEDSSSWAIDHILPQKYLWPLTTKNACLLSTEENSNKRDKWPNEFYTNVELVKLAKITGADLGLLTSEVPVINTNIDVNGGVDRYLKVRNSNVDMNKRIEEIRSVLESYNLVDKLDAQHKSILGYNLP